MTTGEEKESRSGDDYKGLSSDELDARFNETIAWIEDKIEKGGLEEKLKDFKEFKNWYFEKFDDLYWKLEKDVKEKITSKLYNWFKSK